MRAEPAHQSLAKDAIHRGGDQVILQPHVQQTGNAAGRVVGMQRGQHQMACQRGLHGDARGFDVAHFADHDDVGVLTHD